MFGRRTLFKGLLASVAALALGTGSRVAYRLRGLVSPQARWTPVANPFPALARLESKPNSWYRLKQWVSCWPNHCGPYQAKVSTSIPPGYRTLTPEDLEDQQGLVVMRVIKPAGAARISTLTSPLKLCKEEGLSWIPLKDGTTKARENMDTTQAYMAEDLKDWVAQKLTDPKFSSPLG